MKISKKTIGMLGMFFVLLLFSTIVAQAGLLIEISGVQSINITITESSGNSSNYFSFPDTANISSATFDITGYLFDGTLEDDSEDSYACEGNFWTSQPCTKAVDENFNTYAAAALTAGTTAWIYENTTIPFGISGANWTWKEWHYGAMTSEVYFWNYSSSSWTILDTHTYGATSGTNEYTIPVPSSGLSEQLATKTKVYYHTDGLSNVFYYEGKVTWLYNSYPSNVTLDLENDGDVEYRNSLELNSTISLTDNFTTSINHYIQNTCSTSTCEVPIKITSDSAGIISFSNISIFFDAFRILPTFLTTPANETGQITLNLSMLNDENTVNSYNLTDNMNSTFFSITYTNSTVSIENSSNFTNFVYINISNAIQNTTYYGNITVTKDNNFKIDLPLIISIASSFGQITLSPTSKTTTMYSGTTIGWSLSLNNTGNRILENCGCTTSGGISSFTTFSNCNNLSVNVGDAKIITVNYENPLQGDYSGNVIVSCTATSGGGLDSKTSSASLSVLEQTSSGGGGGGGVPSKGICDIFATERIIISPDEPVQQLIIINHESFSILPSFSIEPQFGKRDGSDMVEIKGEIGSVLGGQTKDVSVITDFSKFTDRTGTYYALIKVSSLQCVDEITMVEIRTSELIGAFPFSEITGNVVNFLGSDLLPGLPIKIWYLAIFLLVLFTFASWVLIKSKRITGKIAKVIIVTLILMLLSLGIIYWLMR